MTKHSGELRENVTRFEAEYAVSAGIMWGAIGEGMVPLYEEHAARIESGYTIEQWYGVDRMERALVVAMRRIDIAQKNLQSDAEIRKAKIDAARK